MALGAALLTGLSLVVGISVHRGAEPTAARQGSAAKQEWVVAAAGDISTTGQDDSARTADLVQAQRPDLVITLGDNQYPAGALADFQRFFDKTWGRFKKIIRPTPGHHEYYTDTTAAGYYTYFGRAANNSSEPNCTAACKGYYSFDVGSWHLVALNTNHYVSADHPKRVCAFVPCGEGSAQLAWLRDDLARTRQPCILAYWSDPRWASGVRHGSNQNLGPIWRALYSARADLVVNGHEHLYERFAKQDPSGRPAADGIREIISGTGGNELYPFGRPLPTSEVRGDSSHGVLVLTLHPDSYSWRFAAAEGRFTDSGTAACNPKPAPG